MDEDYEGAERRIKSHPAVHNLHRRMDAQDALLLEVRNLIITHIANVEEQKRNYAPMAAALEQIAILWRASRIIIPALVAFSVAAAATAQWFKEHYK
jgi:hypothetical protein